jgi:hypothetical protein
VPQRAEPDLGSRRTISGAGGSQGDRISCFLQGTSFLKLTPIKVRRDGATRLAAGTGNRFHVENPRQLVNRKPPHPLLPRVPAAIAWGAASASSLASTRKSKETTTKLGKGHAIAVISDSYYPFPLRRKILAINYDNSRVCVV